MRYWVQGNDSKPYGPYELDVIQQYVADGRLSPTNLACAEGASQWVPIGALAGVLNTPPLTASPKAMPGTTAISPLVIAAWILGPLSLACSLLTGIPAIICAAIAMGQPGQRTRAVPALITAIVCAVLGAICGLIIALQR